MRVQPSERTPEKVLTLENSIAFHPGLLVGQYPQMLRVFELIRTAAATQSSVVILGESETGKKLVAWHPRARTIVQKIGLVSAPLVRRCAKAKNSKPLRTSRAVYSMLGRRWS